MVPDRPSRPPPPFLAPGLQAAAEAEVTEEMTAAAVGSGDVRVLATPWVAILVERAAVAAVHEALSPGMTSVGVSIAVDHLAATPVGERVVAVAILEGVTGRRLRFRATVRDDAGEVATATHKRVLVNRGRFESKASSRLRSGRTR